MRSADQTLVDSSNRQIANSMLCAVSDYMINECSQNVNSEWEKMEAQKKYAGSEVKRSSCSCRLCDSLVA